MSADPRRQAELLRLARVLGVPAGRLAVLDDVPAHELCELRLAVSDRLLERNRRQLERAVALADHIPIGLAAKLAEHAMGAVLGGRAAALLTPEKAGELADRLPPVFLADVACHVDLRKVGGLLGGIDTQTMAAAGTELRRREEWIVLAAFVGHVRRQVLAELLGVFDGETLLRAGFLVEEPERLDAVVALLGDERLDELLQAAWTHDLWREAVALVAHLGPAQGARVVAAIERLDEPVLGRLEELLVHDADLRAAAGPLIALAPAVLRARIGA